MSKPHELRLNRHVTWTYRALFGNTKVALKSAVLALFWRCILRCAFLVVPPGPIFFQSLAFCFWVLASQNRSWRPKIDRGVLFLVVPAPKMHVCLGSEPSCSMKRASSALFNRNYTWHPTQNYLKLPGAYSSPLRTQQANRPGGTSLASRASNVKTSSLRPQRKA